MEPDTVFVQVRNVHRAIATTAELLGRDNLRAKDGSLYRGLVLPPAAALEDAVADSVMLYGHYGHLHQFAFMDPMFYGNQARNVQLALKDNAQLQKMKNELNWVVEKSQPLKLSTMSDTFITELVESLSKIVRDNASVVTDQHFDTRSLKSSQPQFQVRLVASLQSLLDYHTGLKSQTTRYKDPRLANAGAFNALQQENRRLAESTAEYKTALATAEQEKARAEAERNLQDTRVRVTQNALHAVQEERRRLAESNAQYKTALTAAEQKKTKAKEELELQATQARVAQEALNALQIDNIRLVGLTARRTSALAAAEQEKAKAQAEHDHQIQSRDEQLRLRTEQYRAAEAARDRNTTENKKLVETLEAYREHNRVKTRQAEELTSEVSRLQQSLDTANIEYTKALTLLREAWHQITNVQAATTVNATSAVQSTSPTVPSQHTVHRATKPAAGSLAPKRTSAGQTRMDLRLDLAASVTRLPPDKVSELSVFAEVAIPLSLIKDGPAVFSRESIRSALGGSMIGPFVRSTLSATPLARKHGFQDFLCINTETNVWAPSGPGKHGFMFMVPGKEDELFIRCQNRHVFVGKGKLFHYCGLYDILRVKPLSKHAWASLPPDAKKALIETTMARDKSGTLTSYPQVLSRYNEGSLAVLCVRLVCRNFDLTVYRELSEANARFFADDENGTHAKRRRTSGDASSRDGAGITARVTDAHDVYQKQAGVQGASGPLLKRQRRSSRDNRRSNSDREMIESEDD